MIEIASIKIGTIFTNAELMKKFGVSNSGGMRRSLKNNLLILIHKKDSVYQDRWQDDKLLYTGMGLKGDQELILAKTKLWHNQGPMVLPYSYLTIPNQTFMNMKVKWCLQARLFMKNSTMKAVKYVKW